MYDVETKFFLPNYKIVTVPSSTSFMQNRRRYRDLKITFVVVQPLVI